MRLLSVLASLLLALSLQAQPTIELALYASGFSQPVDIAHAGDERLFVVQRNGIIRVLDGTGNTLPSPFLDITDRVLDNASERGLLGLAFHPSYADNGFFYVNYTGPGGATRISRFSVNPNDPNLGDPSSELILLTIPQPEWNHNGGDLNFGPDGYLYTGMGDGGGAGDLNNNAQTTTLLLGKMLRIDVDNPATGANYGIPADNPFADPNDGVADEIWAIGVRNPWRFSFDRETGDMWMADVGQNAWEEINFQPAGSPGGENYGWRCYEANAPYNLSGCGPANDYVFPIREYNHSGGQHCSVTGGFVYRGCRYPGLVGHYFYTDYCSGQFWSIKSDGAGGWETYTLANLSNQQYVSFGEDAAGELYVAAIVQGAIYRLQEVDGAFEVQADIVHENCAGAANGSITLSWPDNNDPVSVEWSDGSSEPSLESLSAGAYAVTVTGGNGCSYVYSFEVVVLEIAPPSIEADGWLLMAPGGFFSYQWYLDGNLISGATGQTYVALEEGNYQVEVFDAYGCSAVSPDFSFLFNDVDQADGTAGWQVWPNPFSSRLEVAVAQPATLHVFNMSGQSVQAPRPVVAGEQVALELGLLPAGVYWVVCETDTGIHAKRVVKE